MSSLSLSPLTTLAPARSRRPGPADVPATRSLRLTTRGRVVCWLSVATLVASASWLAVGGAAAGMVGDDAVAVAPAAAGTSVTITVEEGESLWLIAQRVLPDRDPRRVIWEIRAANNLRSNMIHPGQVLQVPTNW